MQIALLVTLSVERCSSVGGVRSLRCCLSFSSTLYARQCSKHSLLEGGCFLLSYQSEYVGSSCHDNQNRRERSLSSVACAAAGARPFPLSESVWKSVCVDVH